MEKRTPKGWAAYFADDTTPVTLSEYMAGCLGYALGHQAETAQALAHIEAVVGTLDEYLATSDPRYAQLAEKRGRSAAVLANGAQALAEARRGD